MEREREREIKYYEKPSKRNTSSGLRLPLPVRWSSASAKVTMYLANITDKLLSTLLGCEFNKGGEWVLAVCKYFVVF